MECKEAKSLLSEYLEGDLGDLQKAQVAKHLSTCSDCAAELETLKRLVNDMGSLKKIKAPSDLLDGIHRQLGIQPEKKAFLSRFKIQLETAGVLASIILVVLFINQSGISKKEGGSGLMKAKTGPSAVVNVETETFSSTIFSPESPVIKELYDREKASSGIFTENYNLKAEMPSEQKITVITAKTNEDVAKVKKIIKELEGEVEKEEANNLYIKIPAKNVPALFDRLETADRERVTSSAAAEESVYLDIRFPENKQ